MSAILLNQAFIGEVHLHTEADFVLQNVALFPVLECLLCVAGSDHVRSALRSPYDDHSNWGE